MNDKANVVRPKVKVKAWDSLTDETEEFEFFCSKGVNSPQKELLTQIDRITGVDKLEALPYVVLDTTQMIGVRVIVREFRDSPSGGVFVDVIEEVA